MDKTTRSRLRSGARHVALGALALAWVVPLAWIILTSFKHRTEVFSETLVLWPEVIRWGNYAEALRAASFGVYLVNSILVVGMILAVQLVTIVCAGYAFARLNFRGRDLLFYLFILQIVFPIHLTFVPNYLTMHKFGLLNTLVALALPFMASGYGTFMIRQAFLQIPQELADAARLDGCGHLRTLWYVFLPLIRPTIVAFSMISVVVHWNDYFWPLLVTESSSVRTLPIGLGMLAQSESGADWTLLMAATVFMIAPLMIAFLIFQKKFISSFMHSGLK
jgi:sn-glycerol 3-phosphate transport system permease protein